MAVPVVEEPVLVEGKKEIEEERQRGREGVDEPRWEHALTIMRYF